MDDLLSTGMPWLDQQIGPMQRGTTIGIIGEHKTYRSTLGAIIAASTLNRGMGVRVFTPSESVHVWLGRMRVAFGPTFDQVISSHHPLDIITTTLPLTALAQSIIQTAIEGYGLVILDDIDLNAAYLDALMMAPEGARLVKVLISITGRTQRMMYAFDHIITTEHLGDHIRIELAASRTSDTRAGVDLIVDAVHADMALARFVYEMRHVQPTLAFRGGDTPRELFHIPPGTVPFGLLKEQQTFRVLGYDGQPDRSVVGTRVPLRDAALGPLNTTLEGSYPETDTHSQAGKGWLGSDYTALWTLVYVLNADGSPVILRDRITPDRHIDALGWDELQSDSAGVVAICACGTEVTVGDLPHCDVAGRRCRRCKQLDDLAALAGYGLAASIVDDTRTALYEAFCSGGRQAIDPLPLGRAPYEDTALEEAYELGYSLMSALERGERYGRDGTQLHPLPDDLSTDLQKQLYAGGWAFGFAIHLGMPPRDTPLGMPAADPTEDVEVMQRIGFNVHNPANLAAFMREQERLAFAAPITIDVHAGAVTIIDGNMRAEVAIKLGAQKLAARVWDTGETVWLIPVPGGYRIEPFEEQG